MNGGWSLDHLFIDQEGIPTLVEVKRSSDTRIRREVVGQMLDYAANAVVYWPVEDLRARFESRCDNVDERPDEVLSEFLNQTLEIGEFWLQVKTNLQAGRIHLSLGGWLSSSMSKWILLKFSRLKYGNLSVKA